MLTEWQETYWSWCCAVNPHNPSQALSVFGLDLVGPFGQQPTLSDSRYFYAIPELVVLVVPTNTDTKNGFSIAWCRDNDTDAVDQPWLVCQVYGQSKWQFAGSDLFTVLVHMLEQNASPKVDDHQQQRAVDLLAAMSELRSPNSAATSLRAWKERERSHVVCTDSSGLGVVVPFDKRSKTGYRHIYNASEFEKVVEGVTTGDELVKSESLARLGEWRNWCNIAADEGDYGSLLRFGRDLFFADHYTQPVKFRKLAVRTLLTAYKLLGFPEFAKVLKERNKQ